MPNVEQDEAVWVNPRPKFFFLTHIEMMSVMFIPRRPNKSTHVDDDEDDDKDE